MSESTARKHPDFLMTKPYKRFKEFCNACLREKYIGLCYGPPGVGKTLSARFYTKWHLIENRSILHLTNVPQEVESCRSILITPTITSTPKHLYSDINKYHVLLNYMVSYAHSNPQIPEEDREINQHCELVIVDEADRLKTTGLEALREIYDRKNIGLILIGMPGFEKRLARYPQLYSRIGFAHHYKPLSTEETWFILENYGQKLGIEIHTNDFESKEVLAAIVRTTHGNFRLIHRIFRQIERILQVNQLSHINKEVVQAARDCLVIGNF